MKRLFLLVVSASFVAASFAQGTTLTKEETANYLHKKAAEVIDFSRVNLNLDKTKTTLYYLSNTISLSGSELSVTNERSNFQKLAPYGNFYYGGYYYNLYSCDYFKQVFRSSFNPAHITKIEKITDSIAGNTVGLIKITLKGTTGKEFYNVYQPQKIQNWQMGHTGECIDVTETTSAAYNKAVSVIYLPYLQSDDSNFNKIRKALEHLRDLLKAEDDPFGE